MGALSFPTPGLGAHSAFTSGTYGFAWFAEQRRRGRRIKSRGSWEVRESSGCPMRNRGGVVSRAQDLGVELLEPDEVAEVLKIPRKTAVELCRRGEIPGAKKVGREWRVPVWGLQQMFEKPKEMFDGDLQVEQQQVANQADDQRPQGGPERGGNQAPGRTPARRHSRGGKSKRGRASSRRADILRRLSE